MAFIHAPFPNKIEATNFIQEKQLTLRGSPAIPDEKVLAINDCFLIPNPTESNPQGWIVIYNSSRDPDNKARPL